MNKHDPRLPRKTPAALLTPIVVRVLPGNPVSDGYGNVYAPGKVLRLPKKLADSLTSQGRVEVVDAETPLDAPLETQARVSGDVSFR